MTDTEQGAHRSVPALRGIRPLGRRQVLIRATVLVLLLALALAVRSSGLLQSPPPKLPPLAWSAQVTPGAMRASQPKEQQYLLLRDSFRIRGIVSVGRTTIEEQAATQALGITLLSLDVDADDPPTAAQVIDTVALIRAVNAAGGTVFLHDRYGTGPVLALSAMVQLVEGVPLTEVIGRMDPIERTRLTPRQNLALHDAAETLAGRGVPGGPYDPLRTIPR